MNSATTEAWNHVNAAVQSKNQKESDEVYTEWATKYDEELDLLGYVTPKNVAAELMKHIKNTQNTVILDVAAGTGKCAEAMKKRQFVGTLDALEINAALLNVAKSKALYRNCMECGVFEGQSLPVEDGTYDAIICAGAMGVSHVEPGCFEPMIKALKKGGVIICTVRAEEIDADYRKKLEEHIEDLVRNGTVEKIAVKELNHYETSCREAETTIVNKVYVYRRL